MTLVKQAYLLLWKDLLLEMRRRDSLLTMFFFGTLLLFVFHFAFDMPPDKVAELAPALLWLAFLFTGTLGLAQLFQAERDNHCLDALAAVAARSRRAILRQDRIQSDSHARGGSRRHPVVLDSCSICPSWNLLPQLFLVTLLGTVGFCVLGTILSAVTLRAQSPRVAAAAGAVSA